MTMENRVDAVSGEADKFPVGLRVLVVDDDLICLEMVETILKKCKFNVTTTSQPLEALRMLREDKNRFEIVITDVIMPVMDGFKLQELIGLEMDIPVILLSAHDDTDYVMKGVELGACDYLLKPCRMMELQNIWLHVFKRKHMSQKDKNKNNNSPNQDDELALPRSPESSDDSKAGQKNKDRNRGEEDETEDPARTQKKPRVVWSEELHEKFVTAITHLTIEKAAPKKILNWMNIKGLTRENVASHLQKYKLKLKNIEAAKIIQENLMHVRSIQGFGLPESRRFPAIPSSSTQPSGVLIQQNTSPNTNNFFGLSQKLPQQSRLPELFQGNIPINNLSGFSCPTSFPNTGVGGASSINPQPRFLPDHLLLQANQHVLGAAPLQSESFDIVPTVASSDLLDHVQSERDWQKEVRLSELPSTSSKISDSLIDLPAMHAAPKNPQPMNCPYMPNGEEHKPVSGDNPNHSANNVLPSADEISSHNDMHNAVDDPVADPLMNFNENDCLNLEEDELCQMDFDLLHDMLNDEELNDGGVFKP